jgi:O-antigen ligase
MWLSGESNRPERLAEIAASLSATALFAVVPIAVIARDELKIQDGRLPIVAAVLAFVLLANALFLEAYAVFIALVAGFAAFLAVYLWPRAGLTLIGVAAVGYLLLAPTIHIWPSFGVDAPSTEWQARAALWRDTSHRIYDNLVLGHGFASARQISPVVGETDGPQRPVPAGPHNLFLQIWYELGLVGAILFSALFVVVLGDAGRARIGRIERGLAASLFVVFLTIGTASFGLWEAWWLAAVWLGVGLLGLANDAAPPTADLAAEP